MLGDGAGYSFDMTGGNQRDIVHLLSYPAVVADNLILLRSAAGQLGMQLVEIEPHELTLAISDSGISVWWNEKPFAPAAVMHRTVSRLLTVIRPALVSLQLKGSYVMNDIDAAICSRNKIESAITFHRHGIPFVPSAGLFPGGKIAGVHLVDGVVTKPAFGTRGRDVHFYANQEQAQEALDSTFPQDLLVIEPQVVQGDWGQDAIDYRAYVVGGVCVALGSRRPPAGQRLSNVAHGATVEPLDPTGAAGALAQRCAQAFGLDACGVDLVEINGQLFVSEIDAWAGFAALQQATGVDVAQKILELIRTSGA